MSKRKLYPDECPVFEVVMGDCVPIGTVLVGLGTNDGHTIELVDPIYGSCPAFFPYVVCPLTPAAVEMWEHVAGRTWTP